MRQSSIPKAVVEALNEAFDADPAGVIALLEHGKSSPASDSPSGGSSHSSDGSSSCSSSSSSCSGGSTTLLGLLNGVLGALAPGKRLAIIQGPSGPDGFVLARDRAIIPSTLASVPASDSNA